MLLLNVFQTTAARGPLVSACRSPHCPATTAHMSDQPRVTTSAMMATPFTHAARWVMDLVFCPRVLVHPSFGSTADVSYEEYWLSSRCMSPKVPLVSECRFADLSSSHGIPLLLFFFYQSFHAPIALRCHIHSQTAMLAGP